MPKVDCPFCEEEVEIEGEDFPSCASETEIVDCPACGREIELSWYAVFEASRPTTGAGDLPSACPACGTLPEEAEHDPSCPLATASA